MYTYSRAGFVALVIIGLLTLSKYSLTVGIKKGIILFFGLATIVLIISPLVPPKYGERIQSIITGRKTDPAIRSRFDAAKLALNTFREHPLIGVGLGNTEFMYRGFGSSLHHGYEFLRARLNAKGKFRVADNTYASLAAQTGIVGLSFFLFIMLFTLRDFLTAEKIFQQKKKPLMVMIVKGFEVGFVGLLIIATFATIFLMRILWLFLALAVSMKQIALLSEGTEEGEEKNI